MMIIHFGDLFPLRNVLARFSMILSLVITTLFVMLLIITFNLLLNPLPNFLLRQINLSSCPITISNISQNSILRMLTNLNINKGADSDELPSIFFKKNCANTLINPLFLIFNLSLGGDTFPDVWKKALVTSILQKCPQNLNVNYRPVSKLNVVVRLIVRILLLKISLPPLNI